MLVARPTETSVFFIDECLDCDAVYEALTAAATKFSPPPTVERHRTHFTRGEADASWLAVVGQRGWIVLTKDKMIRRHELEVRVLMSAGVAAFILTAPNLSGEAMGEALGRAMKSMLKTVEKMNRPFIARVVKSGDTSTIKDSGRRGGVKR